MVESKNNNINLVGEIAGFTSLRDVDLLELSLLKSVYGIVNPIIVSLISMDNRNIVLKKVDYSASKHGTITTKVAATDDLISACDKLDNSNLQYCSISLKPEITLSLFLLSNTRKVAHYVAIESSEFAISKSHAQEILGMLKIYRNFKQLLQESQTDELTGLSNRKAFDHVTRKIHDIIPASPESINEDKRVAGEANDYWLALADIDHFKMINDSQGHLMGDEVLVRVAQCIQSEIRDTDLLFRYGGEEFAIIVAGKTESDVMSMLERVRLAVQSINIPKIGNITISIGAVEMKKDVFYLTLIEQADRSLYQSKAAGRNKTTLYSENTTDIEEHSASSEVELF